VAALPMPANDTGFYCCKQVRLEAPCNPCTRNQAPAPAAAKPPTEITDQGGQYVIPGAEKKQKPGARQFDFLI
jgi:hypothetical protein